MIGALFVPSIILLVAVIIDVKTYKIPNTWVVISIVLALISSYYFYDFNGLREGSRAACVALAMLLPLVLLGVLGAGDMKIMFAFGFASTYPVVFTVIIFSFVWAAIVGIALALVKGRGLELLLNTVRIATAGPGERKDLQRLPYSIALILGWITFLILGANQGAF